MGQISVLTGPERRRRWSEDERCRIVAEAFAPGSCVAQVARDHDIATGLIYTWRRRLRQDLADQGFVEAAMEPIKEAAPSGGVIVVGLTGSGRIRICGSAPPLLVSAVLKALRCFRSPMACGYGWRRAIPICGAAFRAWLCRCRRS